MVLTAFQVYLFVVKATSTSHLLFSIYSKQWLTLACLSICLQVWNAAGKEEDFLPWNMLKCSQLVLNASWDSWKSRGHALRWIRLRFWGERIGTSTTAALWIRAHTTSEVETLEPLRYRSSFSLGYPSPPLWPVAEGNKLGGSQLTAVKLLGCWTDGWCF